MCVKKVLNVELCCCAIFSCGELVNWAILLLAKMNFHEDEVMYEICMKVFWSIDSK